MNTVTAEKIAKAWDGAILFRSGCFPDGSFDEDHIVVEKAEEHPVCFACGRRTEAETWKAAVKRGELRIVDTTGENQACFCVLFCLKCAAEMPNSERFTPFARWMYRQRKWTESGNEKEMSVFNNALNELKARGNTHVRLTDALLSNEARMRWADAFYGRYTSRDVPISSATKALVIADIIVDMGAAAPSAGFADSCPAREPKEP